MRIQIIGTAIVGALAFMASLSTRNSASYDRNDYLSYNPDKLKLQEVPETDFDKLKKIIKENGQTIFSGSLNISPLSDKNIEISMIRKQFENDLNKILKQSLPTTAFTMRIWRTPDDRIPCESKDTTYYNISCMKEIAYSNELKQNIFERYYPADWNKANEQCVAIITCGHIIFTEDNSLSHFPHSSPIPPSVSVKTKDIEIGQLVLWKDMKFKVLENRDGILLTKDNVGYYSVFENLTEVLLDEEFILLSRDNADKNIIALNTNTTSVLIDRIHSHHSLFGLSTFQLLSFFPQSFNVFLISAIKEFDRWPKIKLIEKNNKEETENFERITNTKTCV